MQTIRIFKILLMQNSFFHLILMDSNSSFSLTVFDLLKEWSEIGLGSVNVTEM